MDSAQNRPDGTPEPCRGEVRFTFVSASQDEAGEQVEAVVTALTVAGVFFEGGSCERMDAGDVIADSPLALALARREAALPEAPKGVL